MTTDLPIASFLMPVYNCETYLAEALDSAIAQTEKNIEIVAVDDGSTDSSREILRRYAARDTRVRVFEEEHKGLVPALNRGLEVARSSYVCRLDADDIAMPDRVEKQVKFLEEHPDHLLVGGSAIVIGRNGEALWLREYPATHQAIKAELEVSCCFTHSCVTYRRAEILKAGGYDPLFKPAEDYELWVRLASNFRLANLPEVVCRYRVHGDQVSCSKVLRQTHVATCIQATFRGASRDMIREGVQAEEKDFVPVLRRLGYRDVEIAENIARAGLANAKLLRTEGRHGLALKLLSDVKDYLKKLDGSSPSLAQVYSWESVVSAGSRDYPRAARSLLLAFAHAPRKTVANVLSRISGARPLFPIRLKRTT